MMNFRIITKAIIDLLGGAAAGRFLVAGYRVQAEGAETFKGNKRTVQVYYSNGNFSKSAGRQNGSPQHRMTFAIGLTVSAPSKVDLNLINNPASTSDAIMLAMSSMQNAAQIADESFDELANIVYQILMDLQNFDLNLSIGTMSDRWIDSIEKDAPQPQGSLVTLTGTLQYTCNTCEDIVGEVGVAPDGSGIVSTQIDQSGDNVERAGVNIAI